MSGNRTQRQQSAQTTGAGAVTTEQQQGTDLQNQLEQRKSLYGTGMPDVLSQTRTAASNLATTGGFDPTQIAKTTAGYQSLADNGGMTPEQQAQFLRSSTAPSGAVYASAEDNLNRQKALQGGYSPGFDAGSQALVRQAASSAADTGLNANVALQKQLVTNKEAGLAGGLQTQQAVQQGMVQGQDALQRYSQFGSTALNQTDVAELSNRLQTGQITMADAQLLTSLAAQDKTLFDQITQGISAVGGAVSGVLTGVGAAK